MHFFIETCITALLASAGTGTNAKRTTIISLPFGTYMTKLAEKILPEKGEEFSDTPRLTYIILPKDSNWLANLAIAVTNIALETGRMTEMLKTDIEGSFDCVPISMEQYYEQVRKTEDYIDYLNKKILKYILWCMIQVEPIHKQ